MPCRGEPMPGRIEMLSQFDSVFSDQPLFRRATDIDQQTSSEERRHVVAEFRLKGNDFLFELDGERRAMRNASGISRFENDLREPVEADALVCLDGHDGDADLGTQLRAIDDDALGLRGIDHVHREYDRFAQIE